MPSSGFEGNVLIPLLHSACQLPQPFSGILQAKVDVAIQWPGVPPGTNPGIFNGMLFKDFLAQPNALLSYTWYVKETPGAPAPAFKLQVSAFRRKRAQQ